MTLEILCSKIYMKLIYSKFASQNILAVCSCHVTYTFQSESTLYSCLNVKELVARSRWEIWCLSDCNLTRTQNHLVRKRTLNHLANWPNDLTKWLSQLWMTSLSTSVRLSGVTYSGTISGSMSCSCCRLSLRSENRSSASMIAAFWASF